ncbi:aspartic peptidase domain-containing protein [Lophiotrema nucula]|uniref:Aspartic peptidase domain-containing protein n=1 Tax=Lophiotrema nucula TaxID=690887 RepID=A0A6A5YHL3_9PLEO|nr:aspartic peptidase domain-containing protein [Lophiotrema nucula]
MFFRKRADNANITVIPAPKVVQATTDFDGNDGSWSTFFINIGGDGENASNGQNFRVLPSTSSAITLVPGVASWCDSECAKGRGVETFASRQPSGFEASSSTSWQEKGIFSIPLAENLQLYPDANPNGTWGTDHVGLGQAGPNSWVLTEQWVVQSTSPDFYMGSFGLAALPVNTGGENRAPFLTNFEDQNGTASTSYGYTAGASYRNNSKGVLGSLVLGGYDQSRFTDQNITVHFSNAGNNSLVVGVQSITYHPDQRFDTNTLSFTSDGQFPATIDSTLPYLWLPKDVCDKFAEQFQLTYDKTRNMYTVDETAHNNNQRTNASMVFLINSGVSSAGSVSITLPYAAFDLQASEPIFNNATRYFPIKQSPTGVFILGRALLQEAYLIVDYDRGQFQIAPANFSDPMPPEHLVTTFPKDYTPPNPSNSSNSNNDTSGGGGLSGGAIAGIVVGILAVALFAALGFFFWRKRQRKQKRLAEKEAPQEIDTTAAGAEVKHRRVSELDSEAPTSPKPSMGGYYGTEGKGAVMFPPINEMESPPAELYSPPPPGDTPRSERSDRDYFTSSKPRRRGATRESSGNNTPGTPGIIHELPGDDGEFQVGGQHFERVNSPTQNPVHSRGPSDASLNTNIDEVIANTRESSQAPPDRRPSMHNRGPSDVPTIQSDSTAVSDPTPEERERWAADEDGGSRRPLSE